MKHTLRSLALFLALQPTLALAQSAPPNLGYHQVWGRLGSPGTVGPSQAIPFATLKATMVPSWVFVTEPPFNAKCDGATDDTAAIQAAINAAPATHGYINIPPNSNCAWAGVLNFKGHNSLTLAGVGSGFGSSGQTSSRLIYNGPNVARAMDFRDTGNDTIIGLSILNTTAAMTGFLIDAGGTNPGVTLSAGFTIKDSSLFGGTSAGTAAGCLNISEAQLSTVDHVWFQRCTAAIHGQNILGQNTATRIINSTFTTNTGPAIRECGESWLLSNDTWEPDVNGAANGFSNNIVLPCKGIVFETPWMGDVTAAGGQWIALTAIGGTISGGRISVGTGAANSNAIGLSGGTGYAFAGTTYDNFNLAIACSNSPTGGRINSNTFNNITAAIQTGCVNFNLDNNSPDITAYAALSLRGNATSAAGADTDIAATANSSCVFRENSGTIACGQILTAGIANNAVTLAKLATQAANTTLANATSGAAVPTALAMPSCSTAGSAINWTTNTGFGCNSAIAATNASNTFSLGQLVTQSLNGTLTGVLVTNSNAGASAASLFGASNGTNNIQFGMRGTGQSAYGALAANTAYIYGATDFEFMSDGGNLIFASGGSTEKARFTTTGGFSIGSTANSGAGTLLLKPQTFASLTACSSTIEGAHAAVTDSSTAAWGATVTGSSTNHVLAYCDGTNWTVAGK